MWIVIVQQIALDFLLHMVYFPVWWYTDGLKRAGIYCINLLQSGNEILAPGLWLQNLFVPMFGQNDWQGRIVSVVMRFINVIARGAVLLMYAAAVSVIFVLWLLWPPFVLYMLFASF